MDAVAGAAAELPGRTASTEAARTALAAGREAERLTARLASARMAADTARGRWLTAREELLDLRTRRLDGMAAELAAGLTEGADCPVCGAVEHPRPATHTGPAVSAEDEERARDAADAAEAAAAAAAATAEERARELAVLRTRAGDRPLPELEAAAADAERALAELTAAAAALPAARARLAGLTDRAGHPHPRRSPATARSWAAAPPSGHACRPSSTCSRSGWTRSAGTTATSPPAPAGSPPPRSAARPCWTPRPASCGRGSPSTSPAGPRASARPRPASPTCSPPRTRWSTPPSSPPSRSG